MPGLTVPAVKVPATTIPTPVTMYIPSMRNSTGSEGFPNYPLVFTLLCIIDKNSLSFGRPYPVTFETVKIGHIFLEGKDLAKTVTSSS